MHVNLLLLVLLLLQCSIAIITIIVSIFISFEKYHMTHNTAVQLQLDYIV